MIRQFYFGVRLLLELQMCHQQGFLSGGIWARILQKLNAVFFWSWNPDVVFFQYWNLNIMSLRPPNVSVFQCCDFVVYIIRRHAIGTSEKITWNLDVVPLMSPLLGAVVFCPQILMLREFGFGTSMYFSSLGISKLWIYVAAQPRFQWKNLSGIFVKIIKVIQIYATFYSENYTKLSEFMRHFKHIVCIKYIKNVICSMITDLWWRLLEKTP